MNIREQLAAAQKAAQEIHDKATAEGRAKTEEEQAEFDGHVAEAKKLKAMLAQIEADAAAMDELGDSVDLDDQPTGATRPSGANRPVKDPGALVVESDNFKAMMAPYPNGVIPAGAKPQMAGSVSIGSFQNAVLTDPALYPVPHKLAPQELAIIDLFQHLNVIEDAPKAIEIDRETFTDNAEVFTEGGDTPKAESVITFTPDTVTLAVIAHNVVVTTQALKHNQILRSRINTRLINGVRNKAQSEVAATLLASTALMQTQAFDTDYATTLRKSVTKAMRGIMAIGGSPVIKVAMAPEDHEALDLELLDAMIALAGQELSQTSRIWRSEVVPVYGLDAGVAFVGDLKQVDFYVGEGGVTVSTGWVDKQFTQNRLTIQAEMEAKAAVIGGAALVATDLDAVTEPNFS